MYTCITLGTVTKVHIYFIHIVDEENISALMIFSLL